MEASTITELIISVVTLISAYFIGNKSVWGQRLGLLSNFGWWFYVLTFERWGLVPMEVFFTAMCIRNLLKWERESESSHKETGI